MLKIKSKTRKLAFLLLGLALFFQLIHRPLPDNIEQPWKYRLICFGAEMQNKMGYYLELVGLWHRVNLTRIAYHYSVGAFNIRDENDKISIHDEKIGHLSFRIYRPSTNYTENLSPTIFFYHGGGYFVGSADTLEAVTYLMAKHTQYLVIYIEYRLIPEHKYPAAHEDSLEGAKYLIKNHKKYGIDLKNLILMGDSAGGNLATVVSQQLSCLNITKPKIQVLVYPILQFFDFTLPSYRLNLPKSILGNINHENFKNFIHYFTGYEIDDSIFLNGHTSQYHKESILANYVNQEYLPYEFRYNHGLENLTHANDTTGKYSQIAKILLSHKVSPLLVDDEFLKKNTPDYTILMTTEIDILRDDGFIYANRLKKIGKSIIHMHYANAFHGIFGLLNGPLEFTNARDLLKKVADNIKLIVSGQ